MEQKLLLNCDWLGLSLHLAGEPQPLSGYIWKEYTATNVWKKRRVLWTEDGDRVLTLLSEPHSSTINAQSALLEIENEWLYHGGGYAHILDLLSRSVLYYITGISRVDLAVDFCPDEAQKEVIFGLASGEYYVKGKSNRVPWWTMIRSEKLHPMWNGRNVPYDQSWGHKTTDIKWKLYYKTKELLDAGGGKFMMKPYIVDQWRINGLDATNVWRVEVSCRKLNNYHLYGSRIDIDSLQRNFQELFLQLYESRFKIRLNAGHKDKSNDPVVTFLSVPQITYTFKKRETANERQHNGRITLLRHLVESLDDEQVLLDKRSRDAVFEHMALLIERDNLQNYFFAMTGKWYDEFISDKELEAKESLEVTIPRPLINNDIQPNTNAEVVSAVAPQLYQEQLAREIATLKLREPPSPAIQLKLPLSNPGDLLP